MLIYSNKSKNYSVKLANLLHACNILTTGLSIITGKTYFLNISKTITNFE